MKKIKIAPSIFAGNFARLGSEVKAIESAGAEMLHLDIMDGNFVPNISFGPLLVSHLRQETNLFFDVHLMIREPERFLSSFVEAGADNITFHLECENDTREVIRHIRKYKIKSGISIKPETEPETLFPYLSQIDMVLVMTVEPGFSGQKFMDMCEKIRVIKNEINRLGRSIDIEVDGGINADNAPLVTEAGANVLVTGSSVFSQDDYTAAIRDIRQNVSRKERKQ